MKIRFSNGCSDAGNGTHEVLTAAELRSASALATEGSFIQIGIRHHRWICPSPNILVRSRRGACTANGPVQHGEIVGFQGIPVISVNPDIPLDDTWNAAWCAVYDCAYGYGGLTGGETSVPRISAPTVLNLCEIHRRRLDAWNTLIDAARRIARDDSADRSPVIQAAREYVRHVPPDANWDAWRTDTWKRFPEIAAHLVGSVNAALDGSAI